MAWMLEIRTDLIVYCLAIALVSLVGGWFPLARRISHVKLQVYLSLSAGAMLGAAFFHMLPEASHLCEEQFGLWMAVGVLGLYVIERFLSPHSHDTGDDLHLSPSPPTRDGPRHACGHAHEHAPAAPVLAPDPALGPGETGRGQAHRASAAPPVAGWSAVLGLFLHTLMGGVALGSAAAGRNGPAGLGFAVFLATVLHKPADAFTISTLLTKSGFTRRKTFFVQLAFAGTIPLGVVLYAMGESAFAAWMESTLTGAVLAFSAGTFVCIAMSDLLPEVQFHSHDRLKLFAAVLAGAAFMWLTSYFEMISGGHSHAGHSH